MSSMTKSPHDKRHIRSLLRKKRNTLTHYQQIHAAHKLARRIRSLRVFINAKHIAFYFSNDGEISPKIILQLALRLGKQCYMPKIANKHLNFLNYKAGDSLKKNRFGINEPKPSAKKIRAEQLDIVFLPLVGFDSHGNRLGMGGGFYDRSFSFKKNPNKNQKKYTYRKAKPYLFGLAHHLQKVDTIPTESWDIDLNAIISDREVMKF